MIGSIVSHYRITAKLGEGAMGVVYKAEDTRLQRVVALKFLSANLVAEGDRQRFTSEAQTAARIQHPNICPIYDIGEQNGQLFFAMAFVEGQTVSRLIQQGSISLDTALAIAIQVCDGLAAAHRQGVIHRDIKGSNLTVDGSGRVWILDFGLALRHDLDRFSRSGTASGTPAYMSPEQVQGLSIDHRTDIWSMGVVLFEMLTGKLPFQQPTQFSVLYAIVSHDPSPVSSLRYGIPEPVEQFLNKALMKNPADRWQTAEEASTELCRIRSLPADRTLTAALPVLAPRASDTAIPRRSPWKARLVAVALTSTAIPAAYFGIRISFPQAKSLPDEKRIAVLPMTAAANDEPLRVIADGVVETLTSKLTQIEEFQGKLMVVPSSEIRNRKIASAEAARRVYGANLVLTGSAQRWGDRIQFTQNLIDTATVRQIASRTFEFDSAQPIALRDGAVNGTVRLLALQLWPSSATSMTEGETSAPEAYVEYLKGVGYLSRYDLVGNLDRAIQSLSRATQIDPGYPLALTALGTARWRRAKDKTDTKEADLALQNVQAAIRLDPKLVEAHIRLAEIYSENGHSQDAIQQASSAIDIAPENGEAYRVLGQAYTAARQFEKAEKAYLEAVKRKPRDWLALFSLGLFYSNRGRTNDARIAWGEARKLTPDNEFLYRNLAVLDLDEGKFREASNLITKTLRFEPTARTYSTLGVAYYYQRKYREAISALNSSRNLDPNLYITWGNLGTVYRHLPDGKQQAQEAFRKAIDLANKRLKVVRQDYNTDANLAEYWAKLGNTREALDAINHIPEDVRSQYADRIVLAFELSGNRIRAIQAVNALFPADPALTYIKNDPDLEALWRDPALEQRR